MLSGIEPNQLVSLFILATVGILLFTEWIQRDSTAILKVPVWYQMIIPRIVGALAQALARCFVRSDSV